MIVELYIQEFEGAGEKIGKVIRLGTVTLSRLPEVGDEIGFTVSQNETENPGGNLFSKRVQSVSSTKKGEATVYVA